MHSQCALQWLGVSATRSVPVISVSSPGCWDLRSRLFPHSVGNWAPLLISAYVIWPVTARGLERLRLGCARVITLHHLRTPLFCLHLAPPPSLHPPPPPGRPYFTPRWKAATMPLQHPLSLLWLDAICVFRDTGSLRCCPMHLPPVHKHKQTASKQCFLISEPLVLRIQMQRDVMSVCLSTWLTCLHRLCLELTH